jgi:hypothetical protein
VVKSNKTLRKKYSICQGGTCISKMYDNAEVENKVTRCYLPPGSLTYDVANSHIAFAATVDAGVHGRGTKQILASVK